MKLITLSEKILKFLVSRYKETLNDYIDFDLIKEHFANINEDYILKATTLLEKDGFITVFNSDNTIMYVTLLPEALRNAEENTLFKKGYRFLKEIRALLP